MVNFLISKFFKKIFMNEGKLATSKKRVCKSFNFIHQMKIPFFYKSNNIKGAELFRFLIQCFAFVLLFSSQSMQGQSIQKKMLEEAISAKGKNDYATAVYYYREYLNKDSLNAGVWFQYAACCEQIYLYQKAIYAYEKCTKLDLKKEFKESQFRIGICLKLTGNYKKAIKVFEKTSRSSKKKNPELFAKCIEEKKICEDAIIQSQTGTMVKKLPSIINKEVAEYSPFYLDSMLYFIRKEEQEGQTYHRLLVAKDGENKTRKISVYFANGKEANFVGGINIHPNKKDIICTACEEEKTQFVCKLYEGKFDETGLKLGSQLPLPINEEGYTFTHPAQFVLNGKTKLFFSSNRQGGLGGMDIWMSEKTSDGKWSNPTNAGPEINTGGDEITPFFCDPCKLLYYSSNASGGLGNFDILITQYTDQGFKKADNLGWIINSGYNDLYPMYSKKTGKLFFASNRLEANQPEKDACCNNIFVLEGETSAQNDPDEKKVDSMVVKRSTLKSLIPLSLFFNNDEPNPKTTKTKTEASYEETYFSYIKQRQKYVTEYSKGLTYDERLNAIEEIESFFEDSVIAGFNDLETFAKLLPSLLQNGQKIRLTFKGFCSPLASSEYNIALAQRRISSLVNYFYSAQNHSLKPYFDNQQLSIVTEEIGELKASPLVSDNPLDKAGSVYSKKAASERKIQIIAVQFE